GTTGSSSNFVSKRAVAARFEEEFVPPLGPRRTITCGREARREARVLATKILMTLVVVAALGLFARRALQLVAMLRLGKPENRLDNVGARIGRELRVVFAQQKLLQWPFPGIMHFFIFWGFVILFTTIVEAFGKVYS